MVDRSKADYAGGSQPDTPWPVAAKRLLSKREQVLYETLQGLYPDHRLFVQVALSQLIDVHKDHPDRHSIRARFSQLVADFVLCRPDLTIVAVIELDDRSHEHPIRQAADARKSKALNDAGLRLIRVPKGSLPSADALRTMIDGEGATESVGAKARVGIALPGHLSDRVADLGTVSVHPTVVDYDLVASRAIRHTLLKGAVGVACLALGWFVYTQIVLRTVQNAFHSLAPKSQGVARFVPSRPATATPSPAFAPPPPAAAPGPTVQELAAERQAELQAAADLRRQKERAWAAYYVETASCEHPVDWNAQVECGNQYMRAKRSFEDKWSKDHNSPPVSGVVLENRSLGRSVQ